MKNKDSKRAKSPVEPTQLTGASRLRFACHPGLDSGEFLAKYTVQSEHHESGLPIAVLKMQEGDRGACPFLAATGCTVYEDRPSICRYYPVGLAALRTREDEKKPAGEQRFYFLIREDHCLGHGEDREWTVDGWREDQGASRDDELNRDWQSAFLSQALPGEARIEPRRQSLFAMTCYDLDAFRRFVFESSFLERFEVDPDLVERIRTDDEELLVFALRYMKFFMMIEQTMVLRPDSGGKRRRPGQEGP